MPRIGLLGGTFDPPHLGHLVIAAFVREEFALDAMRLLVAGDPWMKRGESSVAHRVKMARLAADTLEGLEVDDRETRRAGPTYTADTLAELAAEEPDVSWYFVVGADAAASLPDWHRVEEVRRRATLVVVDRPGHAAPSDDATLVRADVPAMDVSSTMLRERLAAGRTVGPLVPGPVLDYIEDTGLYRHDDE